MNIMRVRTKCQTRALAFPAISLRRRPWRGPSRAKSARRRDLARYRHCLQNGDWLEFRRFCETSCLYPILLTGNLAPQNLRPLYTNGS